MTEIHIAYSVIWVNIVVHHFLHLPFGQIDSFLDTQHQTADKLVLGDHSAAQFVVIAEELCGTDAIFVDSDLDSTKDLVEFFVSCYLLDKWKQCYLSAISSQGKYPTLFATDCELHVQASV